MLGFAPLAANPLAALSAVLVTIASPIEATGGIAFGGEGNTDANVFVSATGGLSFGGAPAITEGSSIAATGGLTFNGTPVWTARAFKQATGGLVFNGNPFLSVAGRPLVITAIFESFTARADLADYAAIAVSDNLTFRGVP